MRARVLQWVREGRAIQLDQLRALEAIQEQLDQGNRLLNELAYSNKESLDRQVRTDELFRIAHAGETLKHVREFQRERVLGPLETVEALRDERMSFTRFGDGEFRLMFRPAARLRFQDNSPQIAAELREALESTARGKGLLLGLPQVPESVHWASVWMNYWEEIEPIIRGIDCIGNSHVTRPPFFRQFGQDGVNAWRSVWDGLSATIVCGRGSRFELIDPLFDNLGAANFLYSRATNAYSDLRRVECEIADMSGNDIALISLGPAGTVLAHTLNRMGIWAIDIGHISSSFSNVFDGLPRPEATPLDG